MDDSYFAELDAEEIGRIEDDPLPQNDDDDHAPPGPDEAVEATESRKVKPKKHIVNPRPKLDDKRLKSQRGLIALEPLFKKVHLKGKGHEVKDLNTVLSVLEHWAHRLFPRMTFDDALDKIEELGHKKSISSYMTLLRMDSLDGQLEIEENNIVEPRSPSPVRQDPFDQLIAQPTSQLSRPVTKEPELTNEQRQMIMRNRLLAEERRLARMKARNEISENSTSEHTEDLSVSSPIIGQTNLSDLSHLEQSTPVQSTPSVSSEQSEDVTENPLNTEENVSTVKTNSPENAISQEPESSESQLNTHDVKKVSMDVDTNNE